MKNLARRRADARRRVRRMAPHGAAVLIPPAWPRRPAPPLRAEERSARSAAEPSGAQRSRATWPPRPRHSAKLAPPPSAGALAIDLGRLGGRGGAGDDHRATAATAGVWHLPRAGGYRRPAGPAPPPGPTRAPFKLGRAARSLPPTHGACAPRSARCASQTRSLCRAAPPGTARRARRRCQLVDSRPGLAWAAEHGVGCGGCGGCGAPARVVV